MNKAIKIKPIDVLYLRGNKLFGEPGDYSSAMMPPWPSVFAGAIRSRIMVDEKLDFQKFKEGKIKDPDLKKVLGTLDEPGTFRIKLVAIGKGDKIYFPLPVDTVAYLEENSTDKIKILTKTIININTEIKHSYPFERLISGNQEILKKSLPAYISAEGLTAYLQGKNISPDEIVLPSLLWELDPRLGIAIDKTRAPVEGMIYTSDTVSLKENVYFYVQCTDAGRFLPEDGLVRLGGDGRGATILKTKYLEILSTIESIPLKEKIKVFLATPGLFPTGSMFPGLDNNGYLNLNGLKLKLVASAVPRYQTISGWDVAIHKPKPAAKAVPVGATYWFEKVQGDISNLDNLRREGLWPLIDNDWLNIHPNRIVEGFNNVFIGIWK